MREARVGNKSPLDRQYRAELLDKTESSFGIFKGTPRYRAKILFTGTAAELVRNQVWHRDQKIHQTPEGTTIVLPIGDDREIIMKILQYGRSAKVLYPKELAQKIAEELRQITDLYSNDERCRE
jgi:predicted DNA-binding transcriptional regulator YafY